jgi:adenylate cyclase
MTTVGDTFIRYDDGSGDKTVTVERLGVCRLGRGFENSIVLNDNLSSREHAMIRRNASGFCILTDLGSRNGTRLNGRPVATAVQLTDGDVLQIGEQRLYFCQDKSLLDLDTGATSDKSSAATQFLLSETLITVLVVDIRGFTMLSQILGEKRISEMMAEVFRGAGEILEQKKAWSQKYIGDAIMAVWAHSNDRITAADLLRVFDVIGEFQDLFRPMQKQFDLLKPLEFGCGINTGFASIGNIGSASSSDFTALGDSVNKAFRLESATKGSGFNILMGDRVLEYLSPALPESQLPQTLDLELKGYDEKARAYALTFEDLSSLSANIATNSASG